MIDRLGDVRQRPHAVPDPGSAATLKIGYLASPAG
jgi:hypothetical protein